MLPFFCTSLENLLLVAVQFLLLLQHVLMFGDLTLHLLFLNTPSALI